MKIGIFGDSFADSVKFNLTLSWTDIVAEKYQVENYALGGSNLYYSIELFEEHHHKFDKIIFLATNPGRIALRPSTVTEFNLHGKFKFISGVFGIERALVAFEKTKEKTILDIYSSLKTYMIYIQDLKYERYLHALMLDKIQSIRPDVILIPCFCDSEIKTTTCLFDIFLKENSAWDIKVDNTIIDLRNCHMTSENNAIFAQKVIDCVDNNRTTFNLNIDEFVTPMNKEFYIRKI